MGWIAAALAALAALAAAALAWLWRREAAARRQAECDRTIALEAERQQIAELAVASERTRILRELHDVIAHSLAIMIAQADGGSYAAADHSAARRTFHTIADTGREALADTRRILGLLRAGSGDDAELAPVPDERSLAGLIAQTRQAGVDVSHIRLGQPKALPSASALAVYRVCQEALTNVLKHAGPGARAVVAENWQDDALAVTVSDEGGRSPLQTSPASPGSGLIGMRERAESVGGTFEAGPLDDGGFRVRAVIPLEPDLLV
jgi:signal transduction histidine kinase